MPDAKRKWRLGWTEVFFFLIIGSLIILSLSMVGFIALSAVRPDLTDRFKLSVASTIIQDDCQRLFDDRKQLATISEQNKELQVRIRNLQAQVESTETQEVIAKLHEERKQLLKDLESSNEKLESTIQDLRAAEKLLAKQGVSSQKSQKTVIHEQVEVFRKLLEESGKSLAVAETTADKMEISKAAWGHRTEWIKGVNNAKLAVKVKGKILDVTVLDRSAATPTDSGSLDYLAIVDTASLSNSAGKEVMFASKCEVRISAEKRQELRVGGAVLLEGILSVERNVGYDTQGRLRLGSFGMRPNQTFVCSVEEGGGIVSFSVVNPTVVAD